MSTESSPPINVVLCCAFPGRREACERWLSDAEDIHLIGTAASVEEVDASTQVPDVVVIDGDPDDPAVQEELARAEATWPSARFLLYSELEGTDLSDAASRPDIEPDGYLATDADEAILLAAVRNLGRFTEPGTT